MGGRRTTMTGSAMSSAPETKKIRPDDDLKGREIELKLGFDAQDTDRLLGHPVLAEAGSRSGSLHAVYYDTPDHLLHRKGFSVRIRRQGGDAIQTIKVEDRPR